MLLSVKLRGGPGHPRGWHVDLPTYEMVDVDYDKKTAIVNVPDECLPDDWGEHDNGNSRPLGDQRVRFKASNRQHSSWHGHLDAMYQEHAKEYRPELS